MKLTTRTTETLVRRLATASLEELEQCNRDVKAIQSTPGQPARVEQASQALGALVRRLAKDLR